MKKTLIQREKPGNYVDDFFSNKIQSAILFRALLDVIEALRSFLNLEDL